MKKEHFNETLEDLEELHEDELNDIVLEKYEKKNKIKRYLLIGGSIFLIFIIVISIVKIVTDSSSTPQEALVEMESSSMSEVSSEDNFEEVPIVSKEEEKQSDEEFKKVIDDVMRQGTTTPNTAVHSQHLAAPHATPTPPKAKPTTQKQKSTAHKSPPKTFHKPKPKPKPKSTPTIHHSGNVYIQVGAFLHYDPNSAFLQKIKKSGFEYKIKEFVINGKRIKRVYIGPFSSREEATKYLPKIRKTISKNAFITKVE